MRTFATLTLLSVGLWLSAVPARAQRSELPPSLAGATLAEAALAEQVPGAFAPAELDTRDFELVRLAGDPSIRAWLEVGSLRWVRAARFAVVPRALVVVEAAGAQAGSASHAGFAHALIESGQGLRATLPLALLSSEAAALVVEVRRDGVLRKASFAVRYKPRPQHRGLVVFDTSCSPYGLAVQSGGIPADSWLYVGCRLVRTGRALYTSPTLELYVRFDNVGDALLIEGVQVRAKAPSVWTQRVSTEPGKLSLGARGASVELGYRLPEQVKAGFLGAGVGPYYYTYDRPDESHETVVPLLTLYAGYAFSPTSRVVYFSATAVNVRGYADQGLYLWLEQFRIFDDRLSMNLLLGANLLVYRRASHAVARVNAPQGLELIFRDFIGVNRNLTAGAFIYPDIYGSAYYNGWLRWGSPRFFGELNFLDWREPHRTGSTRTQSLGMTFGMPLFRFL